VANYNTVGLQYITIEKERLMVCIGSSQRNPVSQQWDVTSHMESHSVTCHPTQVNKPHLNPSQ